MSSSSLAVPRPPLARVAAVAAIVALAFAAPSVASVVSGLAAPSEPRLSRAILSCFGGITLPILGAAVSGVVLGVRATMRVRLDRLVSAGLSPQRAIVRPSLVAIVTAALSAAVVGAAIVSLLRLALHLGTRRLLAVDALGTAWALSLGTAVWTAMALSLVARTGRPGRAYLVVAVDLATRLLPGALAWIAPSAHVANLLGAPPPRGLLHVPLLDQRVSAAVLGASFVAFALLAARRYQGAPPR